MSFLYAHCYDNEYCTYTIFWIYSNKQVVSWTKGASQSHTFTYFYTAIFALNNFDTPV